MSLKRKLHTQIEIDNLEDTDAKFDNGNFEIGVDTNIIVLNKKIKVDTKKFYDIPIELYQLIIKNDLQLLNTILQVSKRIKLAIYNNKNYIIACILECKKYKKSNILRICFKNGYSEVIKLLYYKGETSFWKPIENKVYSKLCIEHGRLGTSLLFKNNYINDTRQIERNLFKSLYVSNFKSLYTIYKNGYRFTRRILELPYSLKNYKYDICKNMLNCDYFNNFQLNDNWELYVTATINNLELFRWYMDLGLKIDIYCFYISIMTNSDNIFRFIKNVKREYLTTGTIKDVLECCCISRKVYIFRNILNILNDNEMISEYKDIIVYLALKYDNPLFLLEFEKYFTFSNNNIKQILKRSNEN